MITKICNKLRVYFEDKFSQNSNNDIYNIKKLLINDSYFDNVKLLKLIFNLNDVSIKLIDKIGTNFFNFVNESENIIKLNIEDSYLKNEVLSYKRTESIWGINKLHWNHIYDIEQTVIAKIELFYSDNSIKKIDIETDNKISYFNYTKPKKEYELDTKTLVIYLGFKTNFNKLKNDLPKINKITFIKKIDILNTSYKIFEEQLNKLNAIIRKKNILKYDLAKKIKKEIELKEYLNAMNDEQSLFYNNLKNEINILESEITLINYSRDNELESLIDSFMKFKNLYDDESTYKTIEKDINIKNEIDKIIKG